MKNFHPLLLIYLILFSACNSNNNQAKNENKTDSLITQKDTIAHDPSLADLTKIILKAISKDYQLLEPYIHPELGVRFSPYGYINPADDITIKQNQFKNMLKKNEKILWGHYDGTGDEIKLTVKEYFKKFVYDVNFFEAEKLSTNKSLAKGNSINNIKEIYPSAEYTESYFSGFEKKYDGMDWKALRLIYKKHANKYYLVGIIHDQWTI